MESGQPGHGRAFQHRLLHGRPGCVTASPVPEVQSAAAALRIPHSEDLPMDAAFMLFVPSAFL